MAEENNYNGKSLAEHIGDLVNSGVPVVHGNAAPAHEQIDDNIAQRLTPESVETSKQMASAVENKDNTKAADILHPTMHKALSLVAGKPMADLFGHTAANAIAPMFKGHEDSLKTFSTVASYVLPHVMGNKDGGDGKTKA